MSAIRTISTQSTPWKRKVLLTAGHALSLSCAVTSAAEILVVTDRGPVSAEFAVQVIELNSPTLLIEASLATHLPADSRKARDIVRQALKDGKAILQANLAATYRGVIEAWTLGISKIPAVVIDRRYVVYGERDAGLAVAIIEQYRSARQ